MTATLAELRADSHPYPTACLVGCETALVLFAAWFQGRQDAAWIAEAGLRATCVDVDEHKLAEMRPLYPRDWEFVHADAFRYAPTTDRQWDVVTADPWTNDFDRCADSIGDFCRVARKAVILATGVSTVLNVPAGWSVSEVVRRSSFDGGVYWTVLERM